MSDITLRAYPDPKRRQYLVPVSVKGNPFSAAGRQVIHWNARAHKWHRGRIG